MTIRNHTCVCVCVNAQDEVKKPEEMKSIGVIK